jgi:hypothetical protein
MYQGLAALVVLCGAYVMRLPAKLCPLMLVVKEFAETLPVYHHLLVKADPAEALHG